MSDLDFVIERARQSHAERTRTLAARFPPALPATDRLVAAQTTGARVFDRVTGQEGEVIAYARENIIVSAARRHNG